MVKGNSGAGAPTTLLTRAVLLLLGVCLGYTLSSLTSGSSEGMGLRGGGAGVTHPLHCCSEPLPSCSACREGVTVEADCRLTLRPTSPLKMTIHHRATAHERSVA